LLAAAGAGTVLDALPAPAGAEDDRTREQRYHDALAEAMRRLAASDLLPERAGQPVKAWVHVSLADLLRLDGGSALLEQWTARVRARWAARRAGASEGGGDGGTWLDGDAAEAIICDAAMAPVVTGEVNVDALEDLVQLCVLLDRHRRGADNDGTDGAADDSSGAVEGAGAKAASGANVTGGADGRDGRDRARQATGPDRSQAREALERAVIGKAVDLLSGPGGLAGLLRQRQLDARLGGPSLPLDVGYSATIPAGSATRSSCATGAAGGPAAATSPRRPARSTTSSTRPTAGTPASQTAYCCARSTTRWSFTGGAGPWS
jgi:Domain of unknown function (DUF222)